MLHKSYKFFLYESLNEVSIPKQNMTYYSLNPCGFLTAAWQLKVLAPSTDRG